MPLDDSALATMAQQLRRHSIRMTTEAGSGPPTTCMSCAEIMSVLFFRAMRFNPADPFDPTMDAFVLSKGHAAPILWAALWEAGAIGEDLLTLRKFTSTLEGHPTPRNPWVRVATGSLGQGLGMGTGMALARRLDKRDSHVWVLSGDGELAEGSVWEGAAFASQYGLDNLTLFADINALGQSGPTTLKHDVETYAARFRAFGWNTVTVDGHSVADVSRAIDQARATKGKPTAIVCRTEKGKGVSFLEGKEGWHGKPLKKGQEMDAALAELGPTMSPSPLRRAEPKTVSRPKLPTASGRLRPDYAIGQEVATREAYGSALVALGKLNPAIVALDADVKNSTFSDKFKAAFPERFFDCWIAEQQMVGAALGLAAEGKIPFVSTFACFLARAYDHLRMGVVSQPPALVVCGTHVGVSIGEDGPSQMGLEDIAMFRALVRSTVLYPCDAVSAERLVELAAGAGGIVYLRMSRPKTKVIYASTEEFPIGGSKVIRSSAKDTATVVAAGITVYEALEAHDRLKTEGIAIRVIDAYSVKPIDEATLAKAASETGRIVTVEDHAIAGGLGEAVLHAVGGRAPVRVLGIDELPRSGTPKELVAAYGIGADAIVRAVKEGTRDGASRSAR